MLVFCQNCFSASRDIKLSVHESNTQGGCSKCGSGAVMSQSVVAAAGAIDLDATQVRQQVRVPEPEPKPEPTHGTWNTRHGIPFNTDYIETSRIREFLRLAGYETVRELDQWWDGSYFEHRLFFLLYPRSRPFFELLLENANGQQRTIKLEVRLDIVAVG
jgi:hypothetical protein